MRLLLKHLVTSFAKPLGRKKVGSRKSPGKGNNLGTLSDLQQFANGRTFHAFGALGIARGPGSRHCTFCSVSPDASACTGSGAVTLDAPGVTQITRINKKTARQTFKRNF